uniref:Uncharacterized protein n=1 Tax=Salix viminalis TaxID=40686 RepID=A0A6N2MF87_SALVM
MGKNIHNRDNEKVLPSSRYGRTCKKLQYYCSSDEVGLCETGISESDGRRTRYNAGPKNGTSDMRRSHEPLSYL